MRNMKRVGLAFVLVCLCAAPAAGRSRASADHGGRSHAAGTGAAAQALLNGLGDALKAVNSRLDDQTALERKAFADGKVQMDNLSGDIRVIREGGRDQRAPVVALAGDGSASHVDPAARRRGAGSDDERRHSPLVRLRRRRPHQCPSTAGQTPQRLYDSANSDYTMGQYPLAIQGFEAFLKYYPKSDLADDAQFWIGESYFNEGKFAEAVTAYSRVISDYPGGNQVPNAYYKRGRALENLPGQMDAAKQSYQTVMDKFADSQAAILAKQRLEALNRPTR